MSNELRNELRNALSNYLRKREVGNVGKIEDKIHLEGDPGESLFDEPMLDLKSAGQEHMQEIKDKLNKYLERYKKTSDDRALALIGAMTVEKELDELLSAWLPTYKKIAEDKDFDFSSKINIAHAAKLIPGKILNAIEPIKRIRNIFAHNLDVSSFKEVREIDVIAPPKQQAFPMLHNKIRTFLPNWNEADDRLAFFELTALIVLGLSVYTKHVAKLNAHIRDKKKLEEIMKD